ncbi:BolA family transcriptional regulator [Kangiella sp. HZ709]|uniref:BolA family protein n=1 Tax=Kangiella sp. HZ709 TaxID=2666328 RepID=UPI0012B0DA7F|nr:BolA family protein [Kangiella sp. HZ709]
MIDNSSRIEKMTKRLTENLSPSHLEIIDDSHKHIGHAGAKDGKGHFTLIISSETLLGKRMLQQHRLIYNALGDLMETDIHALSIKIH